MHELFALIAFVAGVPMVLIGYIWFLVVSKKFGVMWMLANILVVPVIGLLIMDWNKAWPRVRWPLIVMIIGLFLVMYTLESAEL